MSPDGSPDILSTAAALGIEIVSTKGHIALGRCIWRSDEHPSLEIDIAKQVWCDRGRPGENGRRFDGGNVFELVKRALNCDFREALDWARRQGLRNGSSRVRTKGASKPSPKRIESAKWVWKTTQEAEESFEQLPLAGDDDRARELFKGDYGFEAESLPDDWRVYDGGVVYRYAMPGAAVGYKWRSIDRNYDGKRQSKNLHGKYDAGLMHVGGGGDGIVVTAGEEKALAANLAGYDVIFLPWGERAPSEAVLSHIVANRPHVVVFANDADGAGAKGNEEGAKGLAEAGYPAGRIRIVDWPEGVAKGYDLADYRREHDAVALNRFLDDAKEWTGGPERLSLLSTEELFSIKLPETDNLLGDRLLSHGASMAIVGPGGLGKSRLLLQLAVDSIVGWDWCGLTTHAADARWLIFQTENSVRRLRDDLWRMMKALDDADRELVNQKLRILTQLKAIDFEVCLADAEAVGRMEMAVIEHEPDIVAFDPLIDFYGGETENDATQMRAAHHELCRIARRGNPDAAVIVIHHSRVGRQAIAGAVGWDRGAYARGSKALYSSVRAQINVAPGSADDPDRLVLACGKNNNGRQFEPLGVRLEVDSRTYQPDPDFDFERWAQDVAGKDSQPKAVSDRAVTMALEAGPRRYNELVRTLVEVTKTSESTVKRAVKNAVRDDQIVKGDDGLYRLPESGVR